MTQDQTKFLTARVGRLARDILVLVGCRNRITAKLRIRDIKVSFDELVEYVEEL